MAHCQSWIADCLLVGRHDDHEVSCQAAIWANNHDTAIRRLAEHLEKQGYRILWVDECQPAEHYSSEHACPLLSVSAATPIVLSLELEEVNSSRAAEFLTIRTTSATLPLDAQLGKWPRKSVPDALTEDLFGQPAPSQLEHTHYGQAGDVAALKTYAILDAAKASGLADLIETSQLPNRSLFKGEAAKEYRDAAPYLVELDITKDFTRLLFTHLPDQPDDLSSLHLWHRKVGLFVRSRASFDTVWSHCRKFTKLQNTSGKWYYFRFWEPGNATILEHHKTDSASPFVAVWHDPIVHSVIILREDENVFIRPVLDRHRKKGPVRLRSVDLEAAGDMRRAGFIKKVTRALKKDHPSLLRFADKTRIADLYQQGRSQNYSVELASYNFIRANLLAKSKGVSFSDLERQVDPYLELSPLVRSKQIWNHLKDNLRSQTT